MDRSSLEGYLKAKQAYEDTKELLDRLHESDAEMEHDIVRGSMSEHPYTLRSFTVEGVSGASPATIRKELNLEKLLEKRRMAAEEKKKEVEDCISKMTFINPHAALAAKYRYLDGLAWKQVAKRLGRGTTKESARKEVERCLRDIGEK